MKGKLKLLIVIIAPLLCLGAVFPTFVYQPDFDVFPSDSLSVYPYDDQDQNGTSTIHVLDKGQEELNFSYTLKNGFQFPYAGMSMIYPSRSFGKLTQYDFLEIEIYSKEAKQVYLYLLSAEPELQKPNTDDHLRHLKKTINTRNAAGKTRVYFNEFYTAEWWYIERQLSEMDLGEPNFDKVERLNVTSAGNSPLNVKEEVLIKSIRFGKDYQAFYIATAIGLLSYYALAGIVLILIKRRKEVKTVIVPHRASEITEEGTSDLDLCTKWFFDNYTDPEVSLDKMALDLGISGRKLSDIINTNFGVSFKQYLNTMRLNEAKSLLEKTDWHIKEIAMKVGFNNTTHFNRAFKQYNELTPLEYRKESNESSSTQD